MDAQMRNPNIRDVLEYLEREPVMLNVLQEYIWETEQEKSRLTSRIIALLREVSGQNAQREREEEPALQEFNEEEAEFAPLPEDDEEDWLMGAEESSLPDEEQEREVPVEMEASGSNEPEMTVRELVLRSRTILIPVLATRPTLAAATPESYYPPNLEGLPEHFRRELQVPQAEPYTVIREGGLSNIVCGFCSRQFGTLKGWRIHASRMHKQDGFCARCGHNLVLPPDFTAAQKIAALEIHALETCARACAAVMNERQAKRRKLDLVGRSEDANRLFVPGR